MSRADPTSPNLSHLPYTLGIGSPLPRWRRPLACAQPGRLRHQRDRVRGRTVELALRQPPIPTFPRKGGRSKNVWCKDRKPLYALKLGPMCLLRPPPTIISEKVP